MRRGLRQRILNDGDSPASKVIFLTGPRGAGKTFLAQDIAQSFRNSLYLNCALAEDVNALRGKKFRSADIVVFDAIHKLDGWQQFIAELFSGPPAKAIVIGNASLEAALKTRHAPFLANNMGRHLVYRVLPFTPVELAATPNGIDIGALLSRGNFPEPYLSGSDSFAHSWRTQYAERLFSEDIPEFAHLYDIDAMRRCFDFLRLSVGEPVSYARIKREAGIADITAKKYIHILEALGVIFFVRPFSRDIPRALKKEPKVYFYDTGMVEGAEKKIENLAAFSLLSSARERGILFSLHYVQTRDNKKINFCFAKNAQPLFFAQMSAPEAVDKTLKHFCRKYGVRGIQIVKDLERERRWQGAGPNSAIEVRRADKYLGSLS